VERPFSSPGTLVFITEMFIPHFITHFLRSMLIAIEQVELMYEFYIKEK
jgi:hypothetical protein